MGVTVFGDKIYPSDDGVCCSLCCYYRRGENMTYCYDLDNQTQATLTSHGPPSPAPHSNH